MSEAVTKETLRFQTEVNQLLKLMIHSLYSNKEIFLRELISNASDAADKLRFEALTDDALFAGDSQLRIRVSFDKAARTITVSDNGIGMNRNEVVENIGTIAKSGTQQFVNALTGDKANDLKLIGQFGVGFYSAFIIADRVTLITRRAGLTPEHGVRWESTGEGEYTIETVEKATRGTDVILHLREGEDEFLDGFRLRSIIRKYSDHISIPVLMRKGEEDEKKSDEEETVNRASALWARPKKDVTADEYTEFYKHIAHDWEAPLAHIHNHVEGKQSYTSLFYIPNHAPFDLWDRERKHGIKLYVRRVFITDDTDNLMPAYLRFVRGVVDSDDLPLNISREVLQRNKVIESIRSASVKRVLGLLEDMAKDTPEKYATFWEQFGKVIKEGPGEDFANREQIARLLRFASTHNDDEKQNVSLDQYISRMKSDQEKIYYITADNFTAAKNSPHLEIFRKKGIEVLLLIDRVDEWLTSHLREYNGKSLQSVAKGDLDLGKLEDASDKEQKEKEAEANKDLLARIKDVLGDSMVKDVRVTYRLTNSPACLIVDEGEMSTHLERLLKEVGQKVPGTKPILEVNTTHPLVRRFKDEQDSARFKDWAHLLFDQALLSEGGQLADPGGFVRRLNDLLLMLSLSGR